LGEVTLFFCHLGTAVTQWRWWG